MMNRETLLNEVGKVAESAGRAILAIYGEPERWAVQQKVDDSPLTAADLAAHRLIVEELHRLTPTIPVLSEESEDHSGRRDWSRLWVVDPLDGTREFVARTNDFTVNIALVENGEAILGVMHAPVYGMTYLAARGLGAWRQDGQRRERIGTTVTMSPPRLLLSRHHRSGAEDAVLAAVKARFGDCSVLQVGSAFKMCRVAEGAADFYPRFGKTMEWDTAAGQILLEEAGGLLVDHDGRPLRYNERDTLVNPPFLVVGERARLPEWLSVLSAA
ncbi:3'(2'),5'-bisphosphate nucleotidase CysQ [Fluviicoccus keumensis]|nr:3'(2'),5'-bisphosphate nucleotidase CysQ [Fluviicoccus keumensis]